MVERLDLLIDDVAAANDPERSARVLVTGLADRLVGVTHPAEAHALADALRTMCDPIAAAVVAVPAERSAF
jgi:hypothetical protein